VIAETGLAALWLAAALSLLQLVLGFGPGMLKSGSGPIRAVAVLQGTLTLFAFAMLLSVFATTDLSVSLVAENSHSAKPLLYKVAATWGNHEGSMLLWVTVLGVSGAALAIFSRRLEERTFNAALGAQGALALGFFIFLLFASNPFARLNPPAFEGRGLNPILQDPGLAFHPPTLYLGYVGLSVAFSLAVGALVTGEVDRDLARAMRPWVLGAWIFLTLGITAGSYWAYYDLGWGGWWFWDPVENASLMPWLAATALLHSLNVLAARDSLRAWTIMLAMIAFSMSMVGTFLVRSGVLTSVHAFAVDPKRGVFLLALLAFYVGAALLLFAFRSGKLTEGPEFELVSREAALVGNNLLLSVILGVVFIGTLYPLFVEALTGAKLSVGAPYFNAVVGPIALALMALITIGPLLNWRSDSGERLKRLAIPALFGVTTFVVLLIAIPQEGVLAKLGFGFAIALLIASLLPLFGRKLRRTPLTSYAMVLAHFGAATAVAGMSISTLTTSETLIAAKPGEIVGVGPWSIRFASIRPIAGPNWTALEATLYATRGGAIETLQPQARFYTDPPTETTQSAILTTLNGQLYTVVGQQVGDRWQLRLWWKPMVTLIWFGGALIAMGGALALVGRAWRGWRKRSVR
jgi:cytochrome c-type biogenesis protein CcmF